MCENELLDRECTDSTCGKQHLRDIGLKDEKILLHMSQAGDIPREQKAKFVMGLKEVIASLKKRGAKEFEEVATELAAYRRRFKAERDAELEAAMERRNGDDDVIMGAAA